jgi:hypothetical protein
MKMAAESQPYLEVPQFTVIEGGEVNLASEIRVHSQSEYLTRKSAALLAGKVIVETISWSLGEAMFLNPDDPMGAMEYFHRYRTDNDDPNSSTQQKDVYEEVGNLRIFAVLRGRAAFKKQVPVEPQSIRRGDKLVIQDGKRFENSYRVFAVQLPGSSLE